MRKVLWDGCGKWREGERRESVSGGEVEERGSGAHRGFFGRACGARAGLWPRPLPQGSDSVTPGADWDGQREGMWLSAAGRRRGPGRGSGGPAAAKERTARSRALSGAQGHALSLLSPHRGGTSCPGGSSLARRGGDTGSWRPVARQAQGRSRRTPIVARKRERSLSLHGAQGPASPAIWARATCGQPARL